VALGPFSYDRATALLTFSGTSNTAAGVSSFIAQLRQSGIFRDVSYDGYAGGVATTQGTKHVADDGTVTYDEVKEAAYAFNVRAVVAPPEGGA